MQTSREVIDALFAGHGAERVGLHDHIWGDTARLWADQGLPEDDEGNAVDIGDHFGFDTRYVGSGFSWEPKPGAAELIEETDEWKIVKNGGGACLKWWKNKSGTPEHVAFTMDSRAVWEKDYRPHVADDPGGRLTDEAVDNVVEAIEKTAAAERYCMFSNRFVWESMRGSMGDENLYLAMVADPDWIHDFCRCYTDMYKACYGKILARAKPQGIRLCEDMGFRDRTFASPTMFGELIFPYFAELIDFFHSHGVACMLHTCGLTEPLLDQIVDVGFDALDPMEVKAGNDAFRIAETYGDRLVLRGGFDERIFESDDLDVVRRETRAHVEGMKSRTPRYIFSSDHSISTNVPYATFAAAIDTYRTYCAY